MGGLENDLNHFRTTELIKSSAETADRDEVVRIRNPKGCRMLQTRLSRNKFHLKTKLPMFRKGAPLFSRASDCS